MGNMSYCRFENTAKDLQDCYENMEGDLSKSEKYWYDELIKLCVNIACDFGNCTEDE